MLITHTFKTNKNFTKTAFWAVAYLLLVLTVYAYPYQQAYGQPKKASVAITSVVEHPALDAVRDGVKAELEKNGYQVGKNLVWQYQTAQGNVGTAAQIARKFAGDNPNVIVAISTPSAQTMMASTKKIPIVFSAITDPQGAKLVPSWEPSGTNMTGVSNLLDIERQMDLIVEAVPHTKKVGIVYNPAEANSVYYVKQLQEKLPKRGIEVLTAAAPRSIDVGTAAQSLAGKVDVFYAPSDNNVVSAFESLARVANDSKTPLISTDPLCAERGAAVAFGVDYIELGAQTGRMVIRILNGEEPGKIAPEIGQKLDLFINPKAAKAQGFKIPQSLSNRATRVIR